MTEESIMGVSNHRAIPSNSKKYTREYYRKNREKWATPKEKKKRAARNAARRKMEKKHGKAALKGKDVHHKKPLRNGGTNNKGNLAIISRKKNRADNGKSSRKKR